MNQYDVLSKIGHYAKVIDYIYRNPDSQATLDELAMIPGYANSCANTHPFRGGMIAGCQS